MGKISNFLAFYDFWIIFTQHIERDCISNCNPKHKNSSSFCVYVYVSHVKFPVRKLSNRVHFPYSWSMAIFFFFKYYNKLITVNGKGKRKIISKWHKLSNKSNHNSSFPEDSSHCKISVCVNIGRCCCCYHRFVSIKIMCVNSS